MKTIEQTVANAQNYAALQAGEKLKLHWQCMQILALYILECDGKSVFSNYSITDVNDDFQTIEKH